MCIASFSVIQYRNSLWFYSSVAQSRMNVLQLYQDGWGTEMTNQECLGLLKEAQSRMNVLQLYQDGWGTERDNEG